MAFTGDLSEVGREAYTALARGRKDDQRSNPDIGLAGSAKAA
jgi:hypothetical protein